MKLFKIEIEICVKIDIKLLPLKSNRKKRIMKLIHLSDLHLGKKVNEFSMLEDQKFILEQIVDMIEKENPVGVIIAGDIYDKPVPSIEAVQLFDEFLVTLSNHNIKVFIISGNHDSPERISFGSRLIKQSGIYMAPVFQGQIEPIILNDEYGEVHIFLLPFIKPNSIRKYFSEEKIETYTEALQLVIGHMEIQDQARNILVAHQFVTGASRCESEEISVGGTDNVDYTIFQKFDYVALGHIHNPQQVQKKQIRYSGTPLKYSFSESQYQKSLTIVELKQKENINIKLLPLIPKHDMREIKGTYSEVTSKKFYEGMNVEDYLHITLTDEDDIIDAMYKLRAIYPNIMKLDYDNIRTKQNRIVESEFIERKNPLELFSQFYENQNNHPMSEEQKKFIEKIMETIWGGQL